MTSNNHSDFDFNELLGVFPKKKLLNDPISQSWAEILETEKLDFEEFVGKKDSVSPNL